MNATSYLRWFFGLFLAGVTLIGATNVIVDPYGIFGLVGVARFNLEKPERLAHGGRIFFGPGRLDGASISITLPRHER